MYPEGYETFRVPFKSVSVSVQMTGAAVVDKTPLTAEMLYGCAPHRRVLPGFMYLYARSRTAQLDINVPLMGLTHPRMHRSEYGYNRCRATEPGTLVCSERTKIKIEPWFRALEEVFNGCQFWLRWGTPSQPELQNCITQPKKGLHWAAEARTFKSHACSSMYPRRATEACI